MNIQEQPTAMTLVDNKIVSMKPIRIAYGTSTELAALDTFAKSLFSAGSRFVCTNAVGVEHGRRNQARRL